jgi:amino acid adenylation domain-containing protein
MEALEHRYYDGVEFIREIARRDSAGGRAVMPIVFTSLFLDIKDDSLDHAPKIGECKMSISQTSQVFIDSQIISVEGGLNVNWDYVADLFDDHVIHAMFDQYTNLLAAISREEETFTFQPGEKELALIQDYNNTGEDIPPATLHGLFMDRAALSPDRIAVEFLAEKMTYRELDERSNRTARFLRAQGIRPGDLVGLIGERCIDTIVNVMGILKAGGAYVPVDPEYPEDRKNYIFQSSNCRLTLAPDLYQAQKLDSYAVEGLDNINTPDDLAYVIYTSGSTGRPKGVIETHRASGNTIVDINRRFAVDENHRIMGISSLCFDLSVYDIFGALAAGAALVLIKTPKDVPHMIETLENKKITLWDSVPAILDLAIDELPPGYINRQLKTIMLSGDWIPLNLPGKIKKHFPAAKTFSLGGATEASIWSIYYPIDEIKESWKSIPYGRPLANQQFYVLDYAMRLCPQEIPGELYIGGVGLASGYLNDIGKTQDSFICHPQLGTLYRTGDHGVLHKEGYIEFLGRKDQQVKIKGHRIELGEIENQLLKQEGVKDAIVLVNKRENGDRYLCAYVVSENSDENDYSQDLRKNLSQVLPAYMIPSHIILLAEMPLTANGKIDRKNLPAPELSQQPEDIVEEEPGTEIEKIISEICKQAAQLNRVGVNDNLFELGITSLDVAKINAKLREAFKIPLPIVKMFEFSTVASLAEYIGNEIGFSPGEKETVQGAAVDGAPRKEQTLKEGALKEQTLKEQTMDRGKERLKQRRKKGN